MPTAPNPPSQETMRTQESFAVRFEVREASTPEIEAGESLWRASGSRAPFPKGEEVATALYLAKSRTLKESFLKVCLWHPDERMPLALLKNRRIKWSTKRGKYIITHIAARALYVNEVEQLRWNPFLDELRSFSLYSTAYFDEALLEKCYPYAPSSASKEEWIRDIGRSEKQLFAEITAASSAGPAEAMLESKALQIRENVFTISPTVSEGLMEAACNYEPYLLKLIENPNLLAEQAEYLKERAIAQLRGEIERNYRHMPVRVLQSLRARGWIEAFEMQEVFLGALLPEKEDGGKTYLQGSLRSELKFQLSSMNQEQIKRFVSITGISYCPSFLARAPSTPLPILRRIARKHREDEVLLALLRRADACADEEISGILSRLRRPELQKDLLEHGSGPAFRRLVKKEIERSPERALSLIQKRVEDDAAIQSLEAVDLGEIFQSPHVQTREAALGIVGRIKPKRTNS